MQSHLLPPSPSDWLPDGHLAYFILDVVAELDLRAFHAATQSKDARGARPYAPDLMVALLLYGYCTGVFSSRRIARATYEDVPFRVIAGECHPHFTRVAAFRRDHLRELEGLFLQVLRLCEKAGIVKLGHVAIDGSKIQANASKHKAMSYDRMKKDEDRLLNEISDLMELAEQTDNQEDAKYGEGIDPLDLPAELKRREDRLAKIREAKEALEREARQGRLAHVEEVTERTLANAHRHEEPATRKRVQTQAKNRLKEAQEQLGRDDDDDEPPSPTTRQGLKKHRPRSSTDGTPKPDAQRNFTDPDSRIMERNSTFLQAYNCQLAVDGEHQVIVAHAVSNQSPDSANLDPVLRQVVDNCGRAPDVTTADAGYWRESVPNLGDDVGTQLFVNVPKRHPPTEAEINDPTNQSPRPRMMRALRAPEGRRAYARRKAVVEPVFGQIKEPRGFRRFLLRGIEKAIGEWSLVSTTHNLLKLFRALAVAA
ncbi:MAG: transposase [Deltaproteobacteria bacterium]|jgi:transposase